MLRDPLLSKYGIEKEERLLHEVDAKTNIQLEQTRGITGFFYKMYIDDSRAFASKFKDKKILDIGAGDGIILSGTEIKAIEMDISINRCRRLKEKQDKVICGNGFNIPLKDNSIDCVLLVAVLEHTSKPELVIDESWRVLKKGGEAIIVVPNDIAMSLGRMLLLKFPARYPGHISFMSPYKIRKWVKNKFTIRNEYNLPFKNINFWVSMYLCVYLEKN